MKWSVVWRCVWTFLSVFLLVRSSAAQTTIVPSGSTWRYLDTGEHPSPSWKTLLYDDSAWQSGPAQLGFSSNPPEDDEATVISRVNAFGETNITFYFRHTFDVADADIYTNVLVRLRRDDGAVVYLNGVEVFRSNMPPGPIDASTLAFLAQDDGAAILAGPINTGYIFSGANVLAVEVHQNAVTSSDISFDLELLGNVMFEHPSVAITAPANDAVVGSPTIVLFASASDSDGSIAQVEFVEGNDVIGVITNAPFVFTNFNTTAGNHTYQAIATDSTGLSTTSAPVSITVVGALVPSRSEWRYLDDGSQPEFNWFTAAFDDTSWSNGVAQIGFGDGDETTVVRQANEFTGTNIVTYYFRKSFDVADPSAIGSLSLRLLRDDGAIVYLNGVEVFRNNMPAGPVNSSTFAVNVTEDPEIRAARVSPSLLVRSGNIIAVEVHQANASSSDISFDLELVPDLSPRAPKIAILSPTNSVDLIGPVDIVADIAATDVDDAIVSVDFYLDGRKSGSTTGEPYSWEFENLIGYHTLLAVATDSLGNTSTSAPVNLVIPGFIPLISTGAVWRYLDTGVDQGTTWRATGFDDSSWPEGNGKFGTNDPGNTTIVKIRTPTGLPLFTTYYRHEFQVADPGVITNLAFSVLRDDGCLAYLNGVEIFRMNMPTGTVTFNTISPVGIAGSAESTYYPTNISTSQLVAGQNVLAIELHQAANTSDAGFDLQLRGVTAPPQNCPPLTIEHAVNAVRLSWTGEGFILQESDQAQGPFTNRPGLLSPYLIATPVGNRFFRLTRP